MLSLRYRLWVRLTVSQTTLCNSSVRSLFNFCCWRLSRTSCSLCLNLYHTSVCESTNYERPCLTCAVLLDAVHRPHDTERKTTFTLHLSIMAVKRLCVSLISSEKHFMAMIYRYGFRISVYNEQKFRRCKICVVALAQGVSLTLRDCVRNPIKFEFIWHVPIMCQRSLED